MATKKSTVNKAKDMKASSVKPVEHPLEAIAASGGSGGAWSGSLDDHSAIPEAWADKAALAWKYYQEVGLVKTAIDTWTVFATGDEIVFSTDDEAMQMKLDDIVKRLSVNDFISNMLLQELLTGDCIGYMKLAKGMIERLICVNPATCAVNYPDNGFDSEPNEIVQITKGEEISLDMDLTFFQKWGVPEFEDRGMSMVLPAFDDIASLRDYRGADRAIAKQWTTPLRFVKLGGVFNNEIYMPTTKNLEDFAAQLETMNPRSAMVVPFHADIKTDGVAGSIPDTEKKIEGLIQSILVDFGLAKTLVTGENASYASATAALKKFVVQVLKIRKEVKRILDWVCEEIRIELGKPDMPIHYGFPDIDITDKENQQKMMLELYDRGLACAETTQILFKLDPKIENEKNKENPIRVDTTLSGAEFVQLIVSNVLTTEEARGILGVGKKTSSAKRESEIASTNRFYEQSSADAERNFCESEIAVLKDLLNECSADGVLDRMSLQARLDNAVKKLAGELAENMGEKNEK